MHCTNVVTVAGSMNDLWIASITIVLLSCGTVVPMNLHACMCAMLCAYMCARFDAGCRGHFGLKAPPSSPFVLFPTLPTQEGVGNGCPGLFRIEPYSPPLVTLPHACYFTCCGDIAQWALRCRCPHACRGGHRPQHPAQLLPGVGLRLAAVRVGAAGRMYSGLCASAYSWANAAHGVYWTHTCDSRKSPHSVSWPDYLCP